MIDYHTRVCLISNYRDNTGGSFRKCAEYTYSYLSTKFDVCHLYIDHLFSAKFFIQIIRFRPNIIHYIAGTSLKSFILLKLLSFLSPGCKTIITAIQPSYTATGKTLIPSFRPDLVLCQSKYTAKELKLLRCQVKLLVGGVDTGKFIKSDQNIKQSLREKYGLPVNDFIVLTIIPVRRSSDTAHVIDIAAAYMGRINVQVVVVVNVATQPIQSIIEPIVNCGCRIYTSFISNIEEFYMLSDCFIFTTPADIGYRQYRMEFPLSILEAMSCNLPIITTRFGAIYENLNGIEGIYFADNSIEFIRCIELIMDGCELNIRAKCAQYDWSVYFDQLRCVYMSLLGDEYGN